MSSPSSPALTQGAASRASYLYGLLLACLGAVLFSAKAIIAKLLYRHGIDAVTLIGLRMLLSLPFYVVVALWTLRREPRLTRRELLQIAALGVLGYYASSMFDFLGLQYISAGLERLILFLTPSFVLLLGLCLYRHRITALQWLSLVLAYAGIALVFWHDVSLTGRNTALGSALVFAAAFTYAVYLLMSGRLLARVGSLRLVALAMIASSLASIGQFALLRGLPPLFDQTAQVWVLAGVLAIVCTVLPVFLTMFGVERIGAGAASQASMVGPASTLVLGGWLLDEPFTGLQLAGTALVMSGVAVLSARKAATPADAA